MSATFNFGLGMAGGLLFASIAINKPVLNALAFQSATLALGAALEKLEASKAERLGREKVLEEALEFAEEKSEFWRRKYNEVNDFQEKLNKENDGQSTV
jgi:hypothetical protein